MSSMNLDSGASSLAFSAKPVSMASLSFSMSFFEPSVSNFFFCSASSVASLAAKAMSFNPLEKLFLRISPAKLGLRLSLSCCSPLKL
eukprot:CAMPEP_0197556888 /NCGR_PEP_ID=MMETSP1320-20131121/15984_1 /TAXON_ID=91990 /ORGANISM="Bolidomonas sp., Strain RCC2347" /LENGTH=86 /DNA_ID=CAMNT_0043118057 /DNA_START=225 /DNA_END=482 /DNA_ORIENTATION=+